MASSTINIKSVDTSLVEHLFICFFLQTCHSPFGPALSRHADSQHGQTTRRYTNTPEPAGVGQCQHAVPGYSLYRQPVRGPGDKYEHPTDGRDSLVAFTVTVSVEQW